VRCEATLEVGNGGEAVGARSTLGINCQPDVWGLAGSAYRLLLFHCNVHPSGLAEDSQSPIIEPQRLLERWLPIDNCRLSVVEQKIHPTPVPRSA
jgi:hypothetical protein